MAEKVKRSKIGKSLSLVAAVLLVTVVSLTACTPTAPAQQFTLRIGFLSTQDSLPYFVMQEQGFDKKNGLQFEEVTYQGGAAIIEALAAGEIDVGVGVGTVPLLSAAQHGIVPEKVIAIAADDFADEGHPGIAVMVSPAVKGWQDLKGQQIAVNLVDSISGAALRGRLLMEGISDYTLVEISFTNMGLALAGGNVAAAVLNEPYLTQSLLRGDGQLLDWIIGGSPWVSMQVCAVVSRTELYRNNPAAVKAYLRAHLQTVNWIEDNQAAARSILSARLNLTAAVGENLNLLRWTRDSRNDPALLESMQPLLIDIGMLKAPIPVNQLYDETLLNEVLAEKR